MSFLKETTDTLASLISNVVKALKISSAVRMLFLSSTKEQKTLLATAVSWSHCSFLFWCSVLQDNTSFLTNFLKRFCRLLNDNTEHYLILYTAHLPWENHQKIDEAHGQQKTKYPENQIRFFRNLKEDFSIIRMIFFTITMLETDILSFLVLRFGQNLIYLFSFMHQGHMCIIAISESTRSGLSKTIFNPPPQIFSSLAIARQSMDKIGFGPFFRRY